jgi:hypothetical protein
MEKQDKWLLSRRGKFTASECYKLLTPTKGESMFSSGGLTYIKQKAFEMTTKVWERPEMEEVESLLHGRAHEYPAYAAYIKATRNNDLTYLGDDDPIFYPYPTLADEAGGTPDCVQITSDGRIVFGAEIKCPKNPIVHTERLKWKDQFDLKMNYILCYAQIQALMLFTGAAEWHFISYDERQILKAAKIKIIEVKPDKSFQSTLEIRIKQAIREKYRIISEYYADYGIVVSNRQEFNEKFHMAA